jgi:hypothetical protein
MPNYNLISFILCTSGAVIASIGIYLKWNRKRPYAPLPEIGQCQIYQHPDAIKNYGHGIWQQAGVIAYIPELQGYIYGEFHHYMDYVMDEGTKLTASEAKKQIASFIAKGYQRYTDDEVRQYAYHYGIHEYVNNAEQPQPKAQIDMNTHKMESSEAYE